MHLVTGAAGFIGSQLAEALLDEGHDVVGVDAFTPYYDRAVKEANLAHLRSHGRFRFVEADLRDALATRGDDDVLAWIDEAGDDAQERLWRHAGNVRESLDRGWGRIDGGWWPRPQERVQVPLAGGDLADRLGRRPMLLASTVLGSLTLAGFAVTTSVAALAALHFLNTAARALYRPANAAALAAVTPPELRMSAFGLRRVSLNIGAAIGPVAPPMASPPELAMAMAVGGRTTAAPASALAGVSREGDGAAGGSRAPAPSRRSSPPIRPARGRAGERGSPAICGQRRGSLRHRAAPRPCCAAPSSC